MELNVTDQDQMVFPTKGVIHSQATPGSTTFYIVLTILAILRIIGNTLVIMVMTAFGKMSTSIYLSVLAVFDNILLLVGRFLKLFDIL